MRPGMENWIVAAAIVLGCAIANFFLYRRFSHVVMNKERKRSTRIAAQVFWFSACVPIIGVPMFAVLLVLNILLWNFRMGGVKPQ